MRDVTVFVIIFPITLRARYLFWLALLVSAVGTFVPFSNYAHGAHLGGLLMGVAYIRWAAHQGRFGWHPFQTRQRKKELVKAASVKVTRWSRPRNKAVEDLPPEEFISREVDPILDKISAHGIQSLTLASAKSLRRREPKWRSGETSRVPIDIGRRVQSGFKKTNGPRPVPGRSGVITLTARIFSKRAPPPHVLYRGPGAVRFLIRPGEGIGVAKKNENCGKRRKLRISG